MVGLMIAAKKYDPARGVAFSTYAGWWIRSYIGRYCGSGHQLIHIPEKVARDLRKADKYPSPPTSLSKVQKAPGEGTATLEEFISNPDAEGAEGAEAEAIRREERRAVWSALGKFPARTRKILVLRFFHEKTLEEIGENLGLTRERVRQIEWEAVQKLRKALGYLRD
jgi:RNA polymerase nonessential primary-like sigma factor